MRIIQNLTAKTGLRLELRLPDEGPFALFIYFHGGGLEKGGISSCHYFSETLCKRGIGVMGVQYHLYPPDGGDAVRYPMYLDDCAAAVAYAFDHIAEYGECTGIFAGGSSAGGYISMMLCFDKSFLGKYGIAPTQLAGFVHDAGQPTAHFNVLKRDRGLDGRRVIVDETAPLYHIGEDEKYPPMLIIVSDQDMENRLEQTELVMSTLRHFGHTEKNGIYYRLEHGTHCAYVYQSDDDGEAKFGKMVAEFVEKVEGRA